MRLGFKFSFNCLPENRVNRMSDQPAVTYTRVYKTNMLREAFEETHCVFENDGFLECGGGY
jgi:hypothetical protein